MPGRRQAWRSRIKGSTTNSISTYQHYSWPSNSRYYSVIIIISLFLPRAFALTRSARTGKASLRDDGLRVQAARQCTGGRFAEGRACQGEGYHVDRRPLLVGWYH